MNEFARKPTLPMQIGILFALLTLVYGFSLGMAFGLIEDNIKDGLKSAAEVVFSTVYKSDMGAMNSVVSKSWSYFMRAHIHAVGLGTAALVVILAVMFFGPANILSSIVSILLGIGSLGYSSFWMFAAKKAPGLGSTGQAKESLALLAQGSSFMCYAGLLLALFIFSQTMFKRKKT